jgi:hypothetical protein
MNVKRLKIFSPFVALALISIGLSAISCASASLLATKITFTNPPGNIYRIGDVPVSVSISNYNIVYTPGEPPLTGDGTLIYFLDVIPPVTPGKTATTEQGTWVNSTSTSHTWHNVGSGLHTISVELVNSDLTPLDPPVASTMQVEIVPEPGDPTSVIISPRDSVTVSPGDVPISAEVNNLILVANTGQAPAPGEGHIIYFMDVEVPTNPGEAATTDAGTYSATADTSYTWHNVPAGVHTFSIELVNDDDTPLSPAVVAAVTINVSK